MRSSTTRPITGSCSTAIDNVACTRLRGPMTGPGAHVVRAAGFYVWSQTDAGHGCPVSMTYAAVPALRAPGVDPAAGGALDSASHFAQLRR